MMRLKGWQTRIGGAVLLVVALDWAPQYWVSHLGVGPLANFASGAGGPLRDAIWNGGPVRIYYAENGHQVPAWMIWLGLVVVSAVLVSWRRDLPHFPWWVQVAGGAVVGGFLGNALELLAVGHVVDFIATTLPLLSGGVGNPADGGVIVGSAVAGGGSLSLVVVKALPKALPTWVKRGMAVAAITALPVAVVAGEFVVWSVLPAAHPTPTAITATASSVPQITAMASSPGSRTLAIRGGKVEWLSLDPTRWTPVALPTRFSPLRPGAMYPTAVAVTSGGVGLAGMSDGVVLEIAPGADHAVGAVADSLWGRVVAVAGMGTLGHLEVVVGTTAGTYSVGLKGGLTVLWPHQEATAVVAPANSQGTWAAVVNGHLRWAPAAIPKGWWAWGSGTWLRFKKSDSAAWQSVWHPGWWFWVPASAGYAWSRASSRVLGPGALLTEAPGGGIAVATSAGMVLQGAPREGLSAQLHTVATSLLGPAAKPAGLVRTHFPTPGNVLVLAAADAPLLVDGYPGWESLGGPTHVHLLADVGGNVVEALAGGGIRAVAINPTVGLVPSPGRSVPGWVGPALGLAVLVVLLVLAGFAAWRLPWRPRVTVFAATGVLVFGASGVAVGRFVIPTAAHYTRSQVQQAWVDGTYAGSAGSWMLTPVQCGVLARAVGWRGPLPTSLTLTGSPLGGPKEVVPTCALWAKQSPAQDHAAMNHPLDRGLNQAASTYYVQVDLGANAPAVVQAESQTACRALPGACTPTGNYGHFMAYYAVRLVFPKKDYGLWQKVMGGAA